MGLSSLLLLVPLGLAPHAGPQATPETWSPVPAPTEGPVTDAGRAQLAAELSDLARWCQRERLFAARDATWRAALALDPDDRRARRNLGYFKKGGAWLPSKARRSAEDHDDDGTQRYRERRRALLDPYRSAVLTWLEASEPRPEWEQRSAWLEHLISLEPDDPALHSLVGERTFGGRWVLEESAVTLERRTMLGRLAAESLADAMEPVDTDRSPAATPPGAVWAAGTETSRLRVLGTVTRDEVARTNRYAEAVGRYAELALGLRQPAREGATVLLLGSPGERDRVLDALAVGSETRELLARADGGWLESGSLLGEWSADPARRLDGTVRQTLGTVLMDGFGITGRHGWAWEGLGLYLGWQLTGTRKTFFFQGGRYGKDTTGTLWTQLQLPEIDWLVEGRALLLGPHAPKLAMLLGDDVNALSDRDLLHSFVLAAYLLEGRRADLPQLLRLVGSGEHPVLAFEQALGAPLPAIEARFHRWLRETGPVTAE